MFHPFPHQMAAASCTPVKSSPKSNPAAPCVRRISTASVSQRTTSFC